MGLGGALILTALMMQLLVRSDCDAIRPYANALSANERALVALHAPLLPKCTRLTEALKQRSEADEMVIANAIAEYAMKLNGRLKRELAEVIALALLDAARRNGIDPFLLAAVVARESSFRPEARSPSGAIGLAQLMPQTATMLGVVDPYDIAQNLDGAARYIGMLMQLWHDRDDLIEMALASYRLGPKLIQLRLGIPNVANITSYLSDILDHYNALHSLVAWETQQRYGANESEGR